jgi:hypothetical protein
MKILIAIVALVALFYFGISFQVRKSTVCVGVHKQAACLTGTVK